MTNDKHKSEKPPATTIILIRHGHNEWVGSGRLAGWTPKVHLDAQGRQEAELLATRLQQTGVVPDAVYSSPLVRTMETAQIIAAPFHQPVQEDKGIGEIDFGTWTGALLKDLAQDPLWSVVQNAPGSMTFPKGESFRAAQFRAVEAVNRLAAAHPNQTIAIVSHADVIKVVLAHFQGTPLDLFQRIMIQPASMSIIKLIAARPIIVTVNDTAHLASLAQATQPNKG